MPTLGASSGVFTVTGTNASLVYSGRVLTPGAYVVSGVAAVLRAYRKLAATSGAFVVSGTAAQFVHRYPMLALSGAFVVSGTALLFDASRRMFGMDEPTFVRPGHAILRVVKVGEGIRRPQGRRGVWRGRDSL